MLLCMSSNVLYVICFRLLYINTTKFITSRDLVSLNEGSVFEIR